MEADLLLNPGFINPPEVGGGGVGERRREPQTLLRLENGGHHGAHDTGLFHFFYEITFIFMCMSVLRACMSAHHMFV